MFRQLIAARSPKWRKSSRDFLERYVSADLRERTPNANRSMASRLPRWIKSAKHRDEVMRAIRRLRATLPEWALTNAGKDCPIL